MASFTTVIQEFSDKENHRTYAISGHTVTSPKLLIQKRKQGSTLGSNQESELQVVYGTSDANDVPLASKVVMLANIRYPINCKSADVTAALAVFRDFVASDEFTALVNSQYYVQ
jgi:fructose-specific component phosphotransferase system IIB-like protein